MGSQQAPAQIAIIGGGPCGLTLARLLEQHGGVNYIVYERDASRTANTTGGCLDLHPGSGQRALEEAGLLDEFKKYARYEDTVFKLYDSQGTQRLKMGEGRDAPEIDRLQLRDMLLASVPEEKIRWSHQLSSVHLGEDGKPVLTFANGDKASGFNLVVGTDGAWSKVRPLITPAKPMYTGRSYIESRIQPDNPLYGLATELMGRGSAFAVSDNHILLSMIQGDRSFRLYMGFDMPEHILRSGSEYDLTDAAKVDTVRSMLLRNEHFGTWADGYKQLIAQGTNFRGWPLYTLPAEGLVTTEPAVQGGERGKGWTSVPGITLAGDSAHLAPPNGDGVNLAMTDALELAGKITSWADMSSDQRTQDALDIAVREYEADMLPKGIDAIQQAKVMTDVMFNKSIEPFVEVMKSFAAQAQQGHDEH